MGDTDLSYEALRRLDDLDARLSVVEQTVGITTAAEEVEEPVSEETA